jgi:Holliday junction resolvase RusA-like endonuclease
MSKILDSYKFTITGRPRVKERPRLTISNFKEMGTNIYNLFQKNNKLSFQDFWSNFSKLMNTFIKIYTPTDTRNYEDLVGYIALNAMKHKNMDSMINVEINLYFSDKRVGDIDNYTKSILDGLHTIMDNDKQVKKVIAEKFIKEDENGNIIKKDQERAEVIIYILEQNIYYKPSIKNIATIQKQTRPISRSKNMHQRKPIINRQILRKTKG